MKHRRAHPRTCRLFAAGPALSGCSDMDNTEDTDGTGSTTGTGATPANGRGR